MMYSIRDTREAVRLLQTYLLEISYATQGLPHIAVDGLSGEETTRALRLFQGQRGLPATGFADYATWQALVRHAEDARAARTFAPVLLPPVLLPMTARSVGSEVMLLRVLLNSLRDRYPDLPQLFPSDRYDAETARAVRVYQRHHSLPASGVVEEATWQALVDEYRRREQN